VIFFFRFIWHCWRRGSW